MENKTENEIRGLSSETHNQTGKIGRLVRQEKPIPRAILERFNAIAGRYCKGTPSGFFKECDACGETVEAVVSADGPNFALRKEASYGDIPETFSQALRIVMGNVEESRASAVAGEHKSAGCRGLGRAVARQEREEVVMSAGCITHVKLDRLAYSYHVADGNHACFRIGTHNIANEKTPLLTIVLIFAGSTTNVER